MTQREALRLLIACFVPHSAVLLRLRLRERKIARMAAERISKVADVQNAASRTGRAFNYEEAISVLVTLGCDEKEVREGSMPLSALEYCSTFLAKLDEGRPLQGLHVGNFVGISLCYFSCLIKAFHSESRLVSIDPNIPHRGIADPLGKVLHVLSHFGCQGNNLILTGYSLEKSISNDGRIYDGKYDPLAMYNVEFSCENQLQGLTALGPAPFDFAVIDGNHDRGYLKREIDIITGLLRSGGLLTMDDVSRGWDEIRETFETLDDHVYSKVGRNGRVGILSKRGSPVGVAVPGPSGQGGPRSKWARVTR